MSVLNPCFVKPSRNLDMKEYKDPIVKFLFLEMSHS
jgi:hypothetical protein